MFIKLYIKSIKTKNDYISKQYLSFLDNKYWIKP